MVELTKTKDEIIKKANELAIGYEARYKGCGECTFLAVLDALRWGGLEIIPKDVEDRFFSGVCVTTAGIGLICDGNCGAVASGALVMGLALGIQGGPGGPLYFSISPEYTRSGMKYSLLAKRLPTISMPFLASPRILSGSSPALSLSFTILIASCSFKSANVLTRSLAISL